MSAGATIGLADINNRAYALSFGLHQLMRQIQDFNQYLVENGGVTYLEGAPFNMSNTDAGNITSAFSDLDLLRQLYEGSATLGSAKDFRAYARWLWGFGG